MKKWIRYILLFVLMFTAIPSFALAANDWSGKLTATDNNINVTLTAPQTGTDNITSLNFRIYISVTSGQMNEPTFQFSDTINSEIKDAAFIKDTTNGSSSYTVDIILSGKKNQSIFTSKQVNIGTISLHPTTNEYRATVDFTGITDDSKKPEIKYLTATDNLAKNDELVNTKPVDISKTTSGDSGSAGGGGGASTDNKPSNTPAPSNTTKPTTSTSESYYTNWKY